MRALQFILALIWLAVTVLAILDDGVLSFRLPFICTSFGLAAVMFREFRDRKDRR